MDYIALIVSIAAFCLSLIQFVRNTTRQKKEATLIAYDELQKDAFSKLNRYKEELSKLEFKSLEWEEITDCLVKIENFSTGVNTGIYSVSILDRLGGGYFIRAYERLQPIIDKKRKDNRSIGKHYNEFEKTVKKLKRRRGSNKEHNIIPKIVMMDYSKICNGIRGCTRRSSGDCKQYNGVICARCILKKYVGEDKDKLLLLKAQSKYLDYTVMSTSLISVEALFVSVFSIYIAVAIGALTGQPQRELILKLMLFMVPIVIFIILWSIRQRMVSIWNEYLNVAIEELEKEYKEQ